MPAASSTVITCRHAASCPGCPQLERPYGEQLSAKRARVIATAHRFPELSNCVVDEVVPADPVVEYRSRAKLVILGTKMGLYAKGSHEVVDLPECRVLDPVLFQVAAAVRGLLPFELQVSGIDLQRADDGVFVTLVVPSGTAEAAVRRAADRVRDAAPAVTGVAVSYRERQSHRVLGHAPSIVVGAARAVSRVLEGGPFHYVAAGSFAQAHRGQQRALVEAILAGIARERGTIEGARVLELFAGAGALALALAARGARVTGVESYEPAVQLARAAAAEQHLEPTFEALDAADFLREAAAAKRDYDVAIVNPPRRGLPPAVRADLGRLSPPLVFYVSCEPATLARDLSDLARRGIVPRPLAPYDMMPLTEEVETLAVLVQGEIPPPEVLFEDDRLIAVNKPPHEPTTPQGEHDVSLLGRVRLLPNAERTVPIHRLDLGTSGVCLFARGPEHVHELARRLAEGEKEYVALARGIVRDKGSINRPLWEHGRVQDARTRYVRREIAGGHSLVLARPDQGRKHQIRRHLASIGHPIVGDERYGDARSNTHFEMRHFLDRPFLHCARIRLAGGEIPLELTAKLAPDLALVLESLAGARSSEREGD